jgi:hypothetical protein
MAENANSPQQSVSAIPPDNPQRKLAIARPDTDQKLSHIGVVGDTDTILLTAKDTAGRFCLTDMHIPPGGGPPRTVTTSKRLSPCLQANSTWLFVARNRWYTLARPSTSQQMRRISFTILPPSR